MQSNYHIELRSLRQYFSVPYIYVGKRVNVLWDNHTVLIYLDCKLIAVHHRINRPSTKYNILPEHMPPTHVKATELRGLSEEKLVALARKVGSHTLQLIKQIIAANTYPQQAFKSCNAILLLQKQYDKERLEAACAHVLTGTRQNYHAVKTILKSGLDKQPLLFDSLSTPTIAAHENVRGAAHYQ